MNTFSGAASRRLTDYSELKMGQAYSLISGYIIYENDEVVTKLEQAAINEMVLAETVSKAVAQFVAASASLALCFLF